MTVNRLVALLTLVAFTLGGASMSVADDLVDTAVKAGTFKTLAAALGAADLVDTLKGKGPFTVLAPSDEAFAKLPKGTVEDLLKPENKAKLKAILLAHVVPGSAMAADVVKLKEAKTAGGTVIKITVDGDVVKVGTAKGMSKVVKTDIKTDNGVIHVIDGVILP
ncbi:MAG: fasciclin domain-containing protein [Planctomycetaceae bacterium]|nr:fasciclin domain-containing protein [Planctomycetaceae bacterium]